MLRFIAFKIINNFFAVVGHSNLKVTFLSTHAAARSPPPWFVPLQTTLNKSLFHYIP
jgi:hypothetical protein